MLCHNVIPESLRCCNLFHGNQTNPPQALCYTENKQIKDFINWSSINVPFPDLTNRAGQL